MFLFILLNLQGSKNKWNKVKLWELKTEWQLSSSILFLYSISIMSRIRLRTFICRLYRMQKIHSWVVQMNRWATISNLVCTILQIWHWIFWYWIFSHIREKNVLWIKFGSFETLTYILILFTQSHKPSLMLNHPLRW